MASLAIIAILSLPGAFARAPPRLSPPGFWCFNVGTPTRRDFTFRLSLARLVLGLWRRNVEASESRNVNFEGLCKQIEASTPLR